MPNRINELTVEQYQRIFADAKAVVAIGYPGMTVIDTNSLRNRLAEKGCRIKFVRNRLARIAFQTLGYGPLEKVLDRQSALVWGGDIVQVARFLVDFQKGHPQVLLHGAMVDGETVVGGDAVKSLAKSPTRDELKSIISGQALSPAGRLSAAFLGAGGRLAAQIKKIAEPEGAE